MFGAKKEIYLSNLSLSQPVESLTRDFVEGRWQLIDYETMEGLKGTMVNAMPGQDCGRLQLLLKVEGPHKVFLGINYSNSRDSRRTSPCRLEVRLSGDYGYRRVGADSGTEQENKSSIDSDIANDVQRSIQEFYWKTTNLKGKLLELRQPRDPYNSSSTGPVANLSYVKLIPLSPVEQETWEQETANEDSRKLGFTLGASQFSDNAGGSDTFHPTDEEWFRDELVPILDTDFGLLIFDALCGARRNYPSKIGHLGREPEPWQDDWLDPLKTFTRLCHQRDLKIFAGMRMTSAPFPMSHTKHDWAADFREDLRFAKRDRNGYPTTGLSIAFHEVREYWLSLLREALEYEVDGIQLHLNRSTPFVMYEDPVVNTFRRQFGEDPRDLPDRDPRFIAHCAEIVTQFVREARALVHEKEHRELGVTVHGKPHRRDSDQLNFNPIRYNCDVEDWLREGLIDYLMPSPAIDLGTLKKWRQIGGEKVHLWPNLSSPGRSPESCVDLAKQYYFAGADGFSVWDGERRSTRTSEFAALQCLGRKKLLGRIGQEGPSWYRRVPLRYLMGYSVADSFHEY